jgi:hypothetical protein
MPMQEGRRSASTGPDDWASCPGHPPQATAGFVGCSDRWPPPADDDPPGDHSARLAEASAAHGPPDTAVAAALERVPAQPVGPLPVQGRP